MQFGVSFLICTFQRSELLKHCLESFSRQIERMPANSELIVIDNANDASTKSIVDDYLLVIPNLKYVIESNIGLSYARNKGVKESNYEWVVFVDDDGKPHPDFIERVFHVINHFDFDVFGGMFYPWHRSKKPKWMSNDFGQMNLLRSSTGPLQYGQTVAGGIAAYKKNKLEEAGLFPTDIGMRGFTVGYGEEDYVIKKMWKNGCKVGFDPHWKMDHLVAEYKYTLIWQLTRSFAKGRDAQIILGSLSFFKKLVLCVKAFVCIPYLFVINLRYFLSTGYYFQNYILDSLRYSVRLAGKISV